MLPSGNSANRERVKAGGSLATPASASTISSNGDTGASSSGIGIGKKILKSTLVTQLNRRGTRPEVAFITPRTSINYNPNSVVSDHSFSEVSTRVHNTYRHLNQSDTDSSTTSSTTPSDHSHSQHQHKLATPDSRLASPSSNSGTAAAAAHAGPYGLGSPHLTVSPNSLSTSSNLARRASASLLAVNPPAYANAATYHHHHHSQTQQHQQQQSPHYDHDRISLTSLNLVLEELAKQPNRKDSTAVMMSNAQQQQRRSSVLRRNWAQHTTDVPYVIGAQIADDSHGKCGKILLSLSWFLTILFFPISLFITLKVVQEYERAVIFRLGRLVKGGAKGPGLFLVLPCIESYTKVDMRTVSFDVPPQEVLTKDSVTVAVDAVVYYRVFNPVISIANVENAQESTRLLAQTSLRNVLGTNSLAEILSNREAVSLCMREILDEATDQWGIKVERVEIKDVRLPIQLQRAMAAEAEATREARAKVIAAEGEHKASRALKNAADILSESPSALQLRYLQTLNNIAGEKNSTIVFPLPIELLSHFMNYSNAKIESMHIQNNLALKAVKGGSTGDSSPPPRPSSAASSAASSTANSGNSSGGTGNVTMNPSDADLSLMSRSRSPNRKFKRQSFKDATDL